MPADVMLQEAINALRNGQRSRSRDLLTRLLRSDAENPEYWLWMSAAVATASEQIYCLQNVLRLDPENVPARQGLVLAGALPPDPNAAPPPPLRRKWTVPEIKETRSRQPLSMAARVALAIVLSLVAFGLVAGLAFGLGDRRKAVAMRPTRTPGPPPTYTTTPTFIGGAPAKTDGARTSTSTPPTAGPTPLWMALKETYTPTPLYVNTPHPISEAYAAGMRAFRRADWTVAAQFFEQAARDTPSADLFYHLGEAWRQLGTLEPARQAFDQALAVDADFAPAYLARARIAVSLDSGADILSDLDRAIQADPGFGEAYLERAAYHLSRGSPDLAESDLEAAAGLLPDSPFLYLHRARLAILRDDPESALEAAQRAHELDLTLLPVYLTLGQAAVEQGEYEAAVEALEVYVSARPQELAAWTWLGQAYVEQRRPNYRKALQAFDRVLALDEENSDALYSRGMAYLAMGEGQKAVNDLLAAARLAASGSASPLDTIGRFDLSLALGRALLSAGRAPEAFATLRNASGLAGSDGQRAALYYWKARAAETAGNLQAALTDWRALLALPDAAVPPGWSDQAQERIAALVTATMTATEKPTKTPTPTRTTRPTKAAPSSTPTSTRTSRPTQAPPTSTPTRTPTRRASPTP